MSVQRRGFPLLVILVTTAVVSLGDSRDGDVTAQSPTGSQGGEQRPAAAPRMEPRSAARTGERVPGKVLLPVRQRDVPANRLVDASSPVREVRIERIAPGLYDVSAPDLDTLLDAARGGAADWAVTVQPGFSFDAGLHYWISSEAGDGRLSREGLAVVDPKLSRLAGIEPGDIIVKVNGYPVTGAYVAFVDMRRDPDRSTVQVELERGGRRMTQIYRLR